MRLVDSLLDILYPMRCRLCGGGLDGAAVNDPAERESALHYAAESGKKYFCAECLGKAVRMPEDCCPVCGLPFEDDKAVEHQPCHACLKGEQAFDRARAPLLYEGVAREAIHLFKYGRRRSLRGYLGGYAAGCARKWFSGASVCVPVPLHKKRLLHRGFNQSLFLAEAAAEAVGIPLSYSGLVRLKHTRPQVELGPHEREVNVKGAFTVRTPDDFIGRCVLLVDDVYTTGATVRECARILKSAGAESVYVLTVARVV